MKLIDKDKLCEDLLNRWSIADTRKEDLIRQVMADVVTPIVVSQPTIEPQKWIPLSERLPEDEQVVLVQDTNGTIWIWKYLGQNLEYRGPYQWMDDNEVWQLIDDVVAWMPLPPVYKGEE